MIRIMTTAGQQILTGQIATCTIAGVLALVHDAGHVALTDVQSIEVVT